MSAFWDYTIVLTNDSICGRAELEMRGSGGNWYLVKWNDKRTDAGKRSAGYWHLQTLF
ncbi:MAG: hypothetical protein JNL74_22380 [Fibrobacteres bacterium]|nr:hypothetical protein [Fibrobacterota bacterium]